tara:strand:- start:5172 stop:5378 length:207 start_codon:yes stop_codon:yes gene_type:complete
MNLIEVYVEPFIGLLDVAIKRLENNTPEEIEACKQGLQSMKDILNEFNAEQNPTTKSVAWRLTREELR